MKDNFKIFLILMVFFTSFCTKKKEVVYPSNHNYNMARIHTLPDQTVFTGSRFLEIEREVSAGVWENERVTPERLAVSAYVEVADETAMLGLTEIPIGYEVRQAANGSLWKLTASDPSVLTSWALINAGAYVLAPNTELQTGNVYNGKTVWIKALSLTDSPNNATIASDVDKVLQANWAYKGSSGINKPYFQVSLANTLLLSTDSGDVGTVDVFVSYTKQ